MSMVYVAVAVAVVSAGVSAYSQYSAGENAAEEADYNAKVAEQNALAEKDKASYDENIHRDNVRKLLSTQRALYGKSGVDMTGSPLLVMEDTAAKSEIDALAIRHGGDIAAAQQRSAATLSKMRGKNAQTAGYIGAGSSLLSGASSALKASK